MMAATYEVDGAIYELDDSIVGYHVRVGRKSANFCTDSKCVAWMKAVWSDAQPIPRTAEDFSDSTEGRHVYCECGTMLTRAQFCDVYDRKNT